MIISATTVKDSRENVEKFLRRNRRGGIDHLVVFLDAPMPEVEELLGSRPDVTTVRAYGEWWAGEERGNLNERQITNTGLLSRLVAGYPWAEWLFQLDGDEVAQIDRSALDGLDPSERVVQLTTLEAVSSMRPERDPTLFKRLLDGDELTLLAVLGVIPQATARSYFRGHVSGKPGLRPSADLALGLHHVIDLGTGERVEAVTDPGLTVLHYESYSGKEFVRKWMALLASGGDVKQHGAREPLARSIRALLSLDLDEAGRAAWLERLFERCALDDVDTLSRLHLLVEIEPDARVRASEPDAAAGIAQLGALLERAHPVPKKQFRPRATNARTGKVLAGLRRGI